MSEEQKLNEVQQPPVAPQDTHTEKPESADSKNVPNLSVAPDIEVPAAVKRGGTKSEDSARDKAALTAKKFSEKNPGTPAYVTLGGDDETYSVDSTLPEPGYKSCLMFLNGRAFELTSVEV